MLNQTLKCLSSRLANVIDCIKDLHELEGMCIIIPAYEALETKNKKYRKLHDHIIFNTQLFCMLVVSMQSEIRQGRKRETVYIILSEEHDAYQAATLKSIYHFDTIIRKTLRCVRSKRVVSTLFDHNKT